MFADTLACSLHNKVPLQDPKSIETTFGHLKVVLTIATFMNIFYTLLSEVCSSGNTMYAALLARRQAAAKLGGPNWEAKLDGDNDVMEPYSIVGWIEKPKLKKTSLT